MTTPRHYNHQRAMLRHGARVCQKCDGDYWLLPVCNACNKGYTHTEETTTEYRMSRRYTLNFHRAA